MRCGSAFEVLGETPHYANIHTVRMNGIPAARRVQWKLEFYREHAQKRDLGASALLRQQGQNSLVDVQKLRQAIQAAKPVVPCLPSEPSTQLSEPVSLASVASPGTAPLALSLES